jgi:hypothetical protein
MDTPHVIAQPGESVFKFPEYISKSHQDLENLGSSSDPNFRLALEGKLQKQASSRPQTNRDAVEHFEIDSKSKTENFLKQSKLDTPRKYKFPNGYFLNKGNPVRVGSGTKGSGGEKRRIGKSSSNFERSIDRSSLSSEQP